MAVPSLDIENNSFWNGKKEIDLETLGLKMFENIHVKSYIA